jgi:hypothetical protein
MKNTEDTTETPGLVLTTSRAGRIVWAWCGARHYAVREAGTTIIVPK